jgi:hypothetical protein
LVPGVVQVVASSSTSPRLELPSFRLRPGGILQPFLFLRTEIGLPLAQEVYDVYPRAVHIDIDHIPNIMEPATINGNVVSFENKCNITVNAKNSIRICSDSNYINGNEYFITEVIDKNTFVINKNDFKSSDIYLYGMLVDDFMSVDYNQVTALNTSAIQELYKLIQQQNAIIQDLQNRISILENNNI